MDSILSVGIDIGTTTLSMVISRLSFSNTAVSYMVPQVDITEKEILYKSRIYDTPSLDDTHLNGDEIKGIIEREYRGAGVTPDMVDSGAVIITGESLLKENADTLVNQLSSLAGEFVVATAGPDLESMIAGKGSGAEAYSKTHSRTVVNLDIGGGTTNIAAFSCGELMAQACLDIGGRLLQYDEKGIITYVSPRLNDLAQEFGFQIAVGEMTVTPQRLKKMTDIMARALEQVFWEPVGPLAELVRTASSKGLGDFKVLPRIQALSFSGGVGDCYYRKEENPYKYGDLGVSLAQSLRHSSLTSDYQLIEPVETIRATVVGAGVYATAVSGSTIAYSQELFPIKNIPVLLISQAAEQDAFSGNHEKLLEEAAWFQIQTGAETLILCMKGKERVSYEELRLLAEGIACGGESLLKEGEPLLILTEHDMAKSLGQAIGQALGNGRDIVCIDNIKVSQGDYIDIGKPIMKGIALPVVVKTLIFQ
ncbi:MAG: ethanolamine ammonia-lyase reactivating factor EutA [Firmicutes bacterium]|jgi:ethanolamine utilization protein EutA|nr:ethanolamine ammonia-lyase reactivating factor EutA [Bacillota bacterium]NBI64877.1 hypothetical protein [Clostridiales bacterium]